jgi:hypothetical protein
VCILQIASEAPGTETYIDFVGGGKQHIRERKAWSTHTLFGLRDGVTEVCQQFYKAGLFLALRGVVSCPIWVPFHPLTTRDRLRITTVIWLIYAEFSNKDGAS